MHTVKVILCCGGIQFSKEFQLSDVPVEGRTLETKMRKEKGYCTVMVKWLKQYIDHDYFTAFCEASLRTLCQLYLNKMGWEINMPEGAFTGDPEVKKMIAKISSESQIVQVLG